jgi:hypothetical protein
VTPRLAGAPGDDLSQAPRPRGAGARGPNFPLSRLHGLCAQHVEVGGVRAADRVPAEQGGHISRALNFGRGILLPKLLLVAI